MGESDQIGETRRELLPHGFGPGTDALEGVAACERHKDVPLVPLLVLGHPLMVRRLQAAVYWKVLDFSLLAKKAKPVWFTPLM